MEAEVAEKEYSGLVSKGVPLEILSEYNSDILIDYINAVKGEPFSYSLLDAVSEVSNGDISKWGTKVFLDNYQTLPKEVHSYVKNVWSKELDSHKSSFVNKSKGKSVEDLVNLIPEYVGKFGDLAGSFSLENGKMINRTYSLFGNNYAEKLATFQSEGDDLEIIKSNLSYWSEPNSINFKDNNFIIEDSNLR